MSRSAAEDHPAEGGPRPTSRRCCSRRPAPGCARCTWSRATPSSANWVVKEVQAVAAAAVPFEVIPGVGGPAAVAAYAGVRADYMDDTGLDFEALAASAGRRLAVHGADHGALPAYANGLLAAGLDATTAVAVTGEGTGETEYTAASTVDSVVSAALGFAAQVVVSFGPGLAQREKLGLVGDRRSTAGRCWCRGPKNRPGP